MTWGKKIRYLRLRAGISSYKFAEKLGVAISRLYYIEHDQAKLINPCQIKRAMDILGIETVSEFFQGVQFEDNTS